MITGYLPKFTLPSGVSDDRHGDGVAMIIDGTSMLIDGFEGGEPTNRMMTWLASKVSLTSTLRCLHTDIMTIITVLS